MHPPAVISVSDSLIVLDMSYLQDPNVSWNVTQFALNVVRYRPMPRNYTVWAVFSPREAIIEMHAVYTAVNRLYISWLFICALHYYALATS